MKITDKEYDNLCFNENLIKEIEKLPNTTKTIIENSKNINNDHKDWNNDNKLNFLKFQKLIYFLIINKN